MSRIKYNLILIIVTILALIAPDFLSQLVSDKDHAVLSGKFIIGLSLFSIALSFTPRIFIFTILALFIFIEVIQFCNLFYYGTLITSSKFRLLFSEIDEVWLVAKEAISFLYLVPLLILIPYGALAFIIYKRDKTRIKSIWAIIPVLLLLAIIPFRVSKAYHGENYYPDPSDHSLRNSLYAVTNCLYNLIYPAAVPLTNYKEYQIESIANWNLDKNTNIILIIGESVNYSHMSLFGYKRETNPLLSTLKTSPNFTYLKGLSSGVSTSVSLAYLINNIYEPNNMQEIENKTANLFRLAKQHNFKTFYISAQSGAFLTNMGVEYIDYKLFRNNRLFLFKEYQDEALLKLIPNLDYEDKNFIVIHQRNAHAPYEENYEHNSKFNYFNTNKNNYQQFRIDTYDNATLYNDFLIYEMIQFYKEKFNGPTYIFFTSDHGEVLDSNKVAFGHAELKKEVAEVPFLAYIKNAANKKIKNIKEPVSHYEISNLIIGIMGFKIVNPNQKPNIFYIHGTELDGHNEFIEYHK